MPYCTQADLELRFTKRNLAQLVRDNGAPCQSEDDADTILGEAAHQARIEACIEDATTLVDLFINVTDADLSIPELAKGVKRIACDAARYYLYQRQPKGQLNQQLEALYDRLVEQLKALQKRQLLLRRSPQSPGTEMTVITPTNQGRELVLDAEATKHF